MSQYEYLPMSYTNELSHVQIPKYQRGIVWTKDKRNDLLETLHKGFPFGVLLVAEDDGKLQLLDGQQRLATIKDYQENKVKYWIQLNQEESNVLLDRINSKLSTAAERVTEHQLEQLLDQRYELADWTDDLDDVDKKTRKELRDLITKTRGQIRRYIELDSLQIPVIKFKGTTTDLPEVFENLNKGGTPLSKYEVFNAAWVNDVLVLPTESENADEILKYVKDYYINMNDAGKFEVSDFSEDELTDNRQVNVAEFARALGQFVLMRVPALMNYTPKNANEIGFGLLGIISGIDNKKINLVHNKVSQIQTGLDETLDKISRISNQLQETFEKILKQRIAHGTSRVAKKQEYTTGLTTTFKLLSYYASLWNLQNDQVQQTLRHLPAYYVYDYVAGLWTAHGDQRLSDYYPNIRNKDYLKPVPLHNFKTAFDRWNEENTGIRKTFGRDIQALITIHANMTYLAHEIPHGEDYEYEHILPKKRVLEYDPKPARVYLSSLGNGMLLPKSDNNRKKARTLYETDTPEKYSGLIQGSNYPTKESFTKTTTALSKHDYEEVNKQIESRADAVIDVIINGLVTD